MSGLAVGSFVVGADPAEQAARPDTDRVHTSPRDRTRTAVFRDFHIVFIGRSVSSALSTWRAGPPDEVSVRAHT